MVDQESQQAEQEPHDQTGQELAEPQAQEEKKRQGRSTLFTVLAAVVVIIVILILLWLLRGCMSGQAISSTSNGSGTAVTNVVLANRVHTAIHPIQLGNGTLADTLVYIIDVARQGKNVVATVRLNVATTDFSRTSGVGGGAKLAQEWESTTLARVPEIAVVQVVDSSGAPIDSMSRK